MNMIKHFSKRLLLTLTALLALSVTGCSSDEPESILPEDKNNNKFDIPEPAHDTDIYRYNNQIFALHKTEITIPSSGTIDIKIISPGLTYIKTLSGKEHIKCKIVDKIVQQDSDGEYYVPDDIMPILTRKKTDAVNGTYLQKYYIQVIRITLKESATPKDIDKCLIELGAIGHGSDNYVWFALSVEQ